jgi:hypothetical protein
MARLALAFLVSLLGVASCKGRAPETVIYTNPLDSLDQSLTKSGVTAEQGALRIDATGPVTIALAEVRPEAAEHANLFYRARLRSQDLNGQAFLEMWCVVTGMGEFFSRGLDGPLTGTSDWVTQQTPFFLDSGQRAELVKLNLVVTGPGKVWIDDLSLAQAPR